MTDEQRALLAALNAAIEVALLAVERASIRLDAAEERLSTLEDRRENLDQYGVLTFDETPEMEQLAAKAPRGQDWDAWVVHNRRYQQAVERAVTT